MPSQLKNTFFKINTSNQKIKKSKSIFFDFSSTFWLVDFSKLKMKPYHFSTFRFSTFRNCFCILYDWNHAAHLSYPAASLPCMPRSMLAISWVHQDPLLQMPARSALAPKAFLTTMHVEIHMMQKMHSISHTLTLTHTLSRSLTLAHTLSHSLTLSYTLQHSLTLSHSLTVSHSLSQSLTLSHTLSQSLSESLTESPFFQ